MYSMSFSTFSRTDCSDPPYLPFLMDRSNLPWHPQRTSTRVRYAVKIFFLYLAFTNSTLFIPEYVHGQRVICSTPETILVRLDSCKANHIQPLTQSYSTNFESFMISTVKLFQSSERLVQPSNLYACKWRACRCDSTRNVRTKGHQIPYHRHVLSQMNGTSLP